MTKKLLVLAILLSVSLSSYAFAQDVDTAWVRRYNAPADSLDYPYAIAVDGSGNVYVTGRSEGISTWTDYATIKYYPNGDTAWLRRYNGPENSRDYANDIAVDGVGNAYVTGQSYGIGTYYDFATIKYYPNGDTAWVRRYNGPDSSADMGYAITVDGLGNVYVTGSSRSYTTQYDYLTIKYHPNGDTAWVRRYDGPSDSVDYARAIAVDDWGNVYVTGYVFSPGTDRDYCTIKYYSNGDSAWARTYNGPGDTVDAAQSIAIDGSGNVYVTGSSYGSGTSLDYATVKYDNNGNELWVKRYNGPADSTDAARAVALDGSGNVYVTGSSFGSGTSVDCVTMKYYADGDPAWVRRYNGAADSSDGAVALAVDVSGNAYVAGYTYGSGTDRDYATIMYRPDGDMAWLTTYNGPADSADLPRDIAVDAWGNVYVTGFSTGTGTFYDYTTIKYVQIPEKICRVFLAPKKLNVTSGAERSFMIHLHPCESMDVSKGDSAEVYVDVDASNTFDDDERYPAVVNSPGILINVYCPDLVDNDPNVEIYSVGNIPISDASGNDIILYLDTFTPPGKGPKISASPAQFSLSQNHPNPFNPACEIGYALPTDCHVNLSIYNMLGQEVRVLVDQHQSAGHKSVKWDGKDHQGQEVTSGVYFYRIQAGDFVQSKSMILLK